MKKQTTSLALTLMLTAPVLYGADAHPQIEVPPFLYAPLYYGLLCKMNIMREKGAFLYLSDPIEHSCYKSVCFCGSEKRERALEALGISTAAAQNEIPLFTEAQCKAIRARQTRAVRHHTQELQIDTNLLQGSWTKRPLPEEGEVLHYRDDVPGAVPLAAVVKTTHGYVFGIPDNEREKLDFLIPGMCDLWTTITKETDDGAICTARRNAPTKEEIEQEEIEYEEIKNIEDFE